MNLKEPEFQGVIRRNRCFLQAYAIPEDDRQGLPRAFLFQSPWILLHPRVEEAILSVIHLPGLRGNPERTYPVAGSGPTFPGTFHPYTASIVYQWGEDKSPKLADLGESLRELGLTWKIVARRVYDTEIEVQVGRLAAPRHGGAKDLVNIADVGLGVSQTLPVMVALLTAEPGQLVHIEQPEIHLHPRAQRALAKPLVNAARRGVRVVVETHSSVLLLGIQTAIAEGDIPCSDVLLHWFSRDERGATWIATVEPAADGTFNDWPVDFDEVNLEAQMHFLNASEARAASA